VQQRREERPVGGSERYLLAVQLSLEHHDLVTQGEDFRVLGPVAHRE
jgi:hypothetical protein